MKARYREFNSNKFSFHKDPVLVVEEFWTTQEMTMFREAMQRSAWKALHDMPAVAAAFPKCGDWLKAEIGQGEAKAFLDRLDLPCIVDYIESFPNIKRRHINFNYYTYSVGDCLSTHDDTDEAYVSQREPPPPQRRIALVTYFHAEWEPDWGGELLIYKVKNGRAAVRELEVSHCILPKPGSLVLFTVPRFHRVCRVDSLAGTHKRLSIAGWFMTEH